MKTYQQLTEGQQANARDHELNALLLAIVGEGLRFDDKANGDDLQARINAAGEKANAMQTPWFAHEYILDTCREDLEAMAVCTAEDALYSEDELVIAGIANS